MHTQRKCEGLCTHEIKRIRLGRGSVGKSICCISMKSSLILVTHRKVQIWLHIPDVCVCMCTYLHECGCVCQCTCVHTYVCILMRVYMHMYVPACMHVYLSVHVYMCMLVYARVYLYVYIPVCYTHACVYVPVHVCVYLCFGLSIPLCVYVCVCARVCENRRITGYFWQAFLAAKWQAQFQGESLSQGTPRKVTEDNGISSGLFV